MKTTKLIGALFILVALTQCKKEDKSNPEQNTFEKVIKTGGGFEPVVKSTVVEDTASSTKTEAGQRWRCTTTTYDAKDGSGGGSGFPLFSPNANVIYPGSLLQGASLRQATPDVIAVDRAGGTISYDIVDGNLQSFFTVDEVTKSSVSNAMNQIISSSSGVVPANFNFTYKNVQSRKQFALEVQADYENSFLELEGYLSLNTDKTYSSYLVRLNQSYYTMSFDIPTNIDQIFDKDVSPADLAKYVGPGNPATYISDVTYGRTYYMLIESTSSVFDMEAGISGSFSAIASSGGGSVDASYLSSLSNLKIQVFAYGGEASSTLRTVVDASRLDSLVNKLASAGSIESGKPLSYVVRSVYDNKVVSVQLANKYDVTNCVPIGSGNTAPAATSHWTGLVRNFGAIGAAMNLRNDRIALFNKAGNRFMLSENNVLTGPYAIGDMGNGDLELATIGAGGLYRSSSGTADVYFFNGNGNEFQRMHGGGQSFSNTYGMSSFLGGSCPFNAQGVGGMSFINVSNSNPLGMLVLNKEGDEYAIYNTQSGKIGWGSAQVVPGSGLEVNGNKAPFTSFGPLCYIRIGTIDYTVFFNKQGTQYALWEKVNGFTPAYDL